MKSRLVLPEATALFLFIEYNIMQYVDFSVAVTETESQADGNRLALKAT